MPMQPRPMAETCGPSGPSVRNFMVNLLFRMIAERMSRGPRFGSRGTWREVRRRCRIDPDPARVTFRLVTDAHAAVHADLVRRIEETVRELRRQRGHGAERTQRFIGQRLVQRGEIVVELFKRTCAEDYRADARLARRPLDCDLRHADAFCFCRLLDRGDDPEIARRELAPERGQATLLEQAQPAFALAVVAVPRRPVLAGQQTHGERTP